jgi:hypothetical protein
MNKVKYVALNRAEGPTNECGMVVFVNGEERPEIIDRHFSGAKYVYVNEGTLCGLVLKKMFNWGETAPEGGGYDKVDFIVGWEGDLSYAGRFDMEKGGKENGNTFLVSLKNRIETYAMRRHPSHMDDEQWSRFCKRMKEDGFSKDCEEILDKCELTA